MNIFNAGRCFDGSHLLELSQNYDFCSILQRRTSVAADPSLNSRKYYMYFKDLIRVPDKGIGQTDNFEMVFI